MTAFPQRLTLSLALVLGGALAVAAGAASAGSATPSETSAHAAATKRVGRAQQPLLSPPVSVGRGSKVVWIWRDGGVSHNVTPSRGRGSKASSRRGHRFSHTFRRRGTFRYTCTIHPDTMI